MRKGLAIVAPMSQRVTGNIRGLAPSQIRTLERLYVRRLAADEIVSLEVARELYSAALAAGRRVGILVSREGRIEEVFVGSRELLYLPDLGRYRLGAGRLRRLRLIYSDLSTKGDTASIPSDIYTDLEKLRLDMVAGVRTFGNRTALTFAHMIPDSQAPAGVSVHTEAVRDLGMLELDFEELIGSLEAELSTTPAGVAAGGALLVGVYDKRFADPEGSMAELQELAQTAGVRVCGTVMQRRNLDPKTLLGKGKLQEVVLTSLRHGADLLIFDTELKPGQWRAITNSTELKVIDRSMLILDIFAQRATSSEGRLQVELAQLRYNLPRLVEKDAGLSRLSGGIGGRGPGETKLEIGRRRIRDRIIDLERRIEQLSGQRDLRKQRRVESGLPVVAILGYTNVGKSTLFNALTGSTVIAENKLFATLDPAQRRLVIPRPDDSLGGSVTLVLSDTVGFIRALPEELFAAFRTTLEGLHEASLLLHVLDAADPHIDDRRAAVEKILASMGLQHLPTIVVLNKIDRCSPDILQMLSAKHEALAISARERRGLDQLKVRIAAALAAPGTAHPLMPNGGARIPLSQ